MKKFDTLCDHYDRNRRQKLFDAAQCARAAQHAEGKVWSEYIDATLHDDDLKILNDSQHGRGLAGFLGKVGGGL